MRAASPDCAASDTVGRKTYPPWCHAHRNEEIRGIVETTAGPTQPPQKHYYDDRRTRYFTPIPPIHNSLVFLYNTHDSCTTPVTPSPRTRVRATTISGNPRVVVYRFCATVGPTNLLHSRCARLKNEIPETETACARRYSRSTRMAWGLSTTDGGGGNGIASKFNNILCYNILILYTCLIQYFNTYYNILLSYGARRRFVGVPTRQGGSFPLPRAARAHTHAHRARPLLTARTHAPSPSTSSSPPPLPHSTTYRGPGSSARARTHDIVSFIYYYYYYYFVLYAFPVRAAVRSAHIYNNNIVYRVLSPCAAPVLVCVAVFVCMRVRVRFVRVRET